MPSASPTAPTKVEEGAPEAAASSSYEETSSDEEEDEGSAFLGTRPLKRRRKLAVPASLKSMFAPGVEEDPSAHLGRKRRVPHVNGNFATLLFVQVPGTAPWRRRASACAELLRELSPSPPSAPSGAPAGADGGPEVHTFDAASGVGWHISLGPMLMLRQQFIRPLVAELGRIVDRAQALGPILFDEELSVFASKDQDRFFAGPVVAEASALRLRALAAQLLGAASELGAFASEGEPPPVDAMRLHCSLAWTLADVRGPLARAGAEASESPWGLEWRLPSGVFGDGAGGGRTSGQGSEQLAFRADAVKVRVGERTSDLPFRRPRGAGAGILGAAPCGGQDSESEGGSEA